MIAGCFAQVLGAAQLSAKEQHRASVKNGEARCRYYGILVLKIELRKTFKNNMEDKLLGLGTEPKDNQRAADKKAP